MQTINNKVVVPSLYGGREIINEESEVIENDIVKIQISKAPRSLKNLMCNKAKDTFETLQGIPSEEWYGYFVNAGYELQQKLKVMHTDLINVLYNSSLSSGIPISRLKKAYLNLAKKMINISEILKHQTLVDEVAIYEKDGFTNRSWRYIPRAFTVAIEVPGNYPSINITWLTALGLKRPVLLSTSPKDPFTPLFLARILHNAGVPDGAINIVCNDFSVFSKRAGQRLLYSNFLDGIVTNDDIALKNKKYHHGKSKLVILNNDRINYTRIAAMIMKGSGRLCTNPSSILVKENEVEIAISLAEELNKYKIAELNSDYAIIPAFDYRAEREMLANIVKRAIKEGAVDISEKITKQPLIIEKDGHCFFRPTVLLIDVDHPIYGTELPFPFVTVSKCEENKITDYCKLSLIVSLVGEAKNIYKKLVYEPTIDKVFSGENYDRGYSVYDAHEEHLLDFLFKKKTIC